MVDRSLGLQNETVVHGSHCCQLTSPFCGLPCSFQATRSPPTTRVAAVIRHRRPWPQKSLGNHHGLVFPKEFMLSSAYHHRPRSYLRGFLEPIHGQRTLLPPPSWAITNLATALHPSSPSQDATMPITANMRCHHCYRLWVITIAAPPSSKISTSPPVVIHQSTNSKC